MLRGVSNAWGLVTDPRTLGTGIALGRVALGIAAMVRPDLPARPWVGAGPAATPAVQVFGRALGGRDVALGLAALAGRRRPGARRLTVGLGAFADGVDMAATLLAWKDLPRAGRLTILAVTVGATGVGVWSAAS
jgi:hypothetical protein